MTLSNQGDAPASARADVEPINIVDALWSTCDRVRGALGWPVTLLLLDDDEGGQVCLVAAAGLPSDLLDILIGASVAETRAIEQWFADRSASAADAVGLDRLGAGTPFALEAIAGDSVVGSESNGVAAVAPLTVRGRVVGALAAYGSGSVEADNLRLIEIAAASAGMLVEQASTAERTRRRSESGQLLLRLANRIHRLRNPDEILDVTVHDLCADLELAFSAIYKVKGNALELAQVATSMGSPIRAADVDAAAYVARAVEHGATVAAVEVPGGSSVRVLLAPIIIRDQLGAVLACALASDGRAWMAHEIELARGVADQLGVALSEAQLRADNEAVRRDLECMLAGSQALAQADDLDTVLSEILCVTEQAVGPRACALLLLDEAKTNLVVRAHRGCDETIERAAVPVDGPTIAAEAVRARSATIAENGTVTPERLVGRREAASALAVPLQLGDSILGALVVESAEPRTFGARETRLALALAHETAVAIHRTQLFDRVALGKREWEATFDAMEDAVFLLDREGRIVRANRAAARQYDREPQALLGLTCCALVCGADPSERCATASVVESGEPVHRDVRLDETDYALAANPIRNRAGTTTGAVLILRRRASEASADQVDVHAAGALARSELPVLLLDRERCVRWANDAAERLYGEALIPLAHITSLVVPEDTGRVEEALARVAESGSDTFDARLRHSGRDVELNVSASVLADGEDVALVLARDTEAGHSHPVALANRARHSAQLTAELARYAVASLARLKREAAERPEEAVVGFLKREAAHLERLDRFSRAHLDRVVEPLELNRIIEAAIETTRPRFEDEARERGVVYDVHFEPCQSARALGNAHELRDAFVELITNAIEAQPAGGRVEIKTIDRAGLVGVRVRDAGEGMAVEVRARAFDPFFTTKGSRPGLGLSTAHGTVLRHGGRLSVRSAPGEGTSFQVVLPAFGGEADGDDVGVARTDALLLVSDRLHRLNLLDRLDEAGVSAVWATDTREVVWALDLQKPRALVLDRGAFFDHGERLVAVARSVPEEIAIFIVGRELPDAAAPLAARPNVRLVDVDDVARLIR